jgi:toxin YoeB
VSEWQLYYIKAAQKDAKNLSAAGLKEKAVQLLELISINPFQNPPLYEK